MVNLGFRPDQPVKGVSGPTVTAVPEGRRWAQLVKLAHSGSVGIDGTVRTQSGRKLALYIASGIRPKERQPKAGGGRFCTAAKGSSPHPKFKFPICLCSNLGSLDAERTAKPHRIFTTGLVETVRRFDPFRWRDPIKSTPAANGMRAKDLTKDLKNWRGTQICMQVRAALVGPVCK